MPPKVRFTREAVIESSFELARRHGMDAVNARAIAGALGCSTQPLFRAFDSMEQIKEAVRIKAGETYERFITQRMSQAEKPYKASGIAYVSFARAEPELFKILFMYDRGDVKDRRESQQDGSLDQVLTALMAAAGMTRAQAERFHLTAWIYVHGLASMEATHFIRFTEDEVNDLISDYYKAAMLLFKAEQSAK